MIWIKKNILLKEDVKEMGTWIQCPDCNQNLPRKYQSRRERRELFDATCDACSYGSARKKYEEGIKKGIWLKKWSKAASSFKNAAESFKNLNNSEAQLISELMAIMSSLKADPSFDNAIIVMKNLVNRRYSPFLNQDFEIPEFQRYDELYYESRAYLSFLKAQEASNIHEKVKILKQSSKSFFNMGYQPLFFSTYIEKMRITNIVKALRIEAASEKVLGEYYAESDDIEEATQHLKAASSSFMSLEEHQMAARLNMTRSSLRMERSCWICGTRSRGYLKKFNFIHSKLSVHQIEHIENLLKQRQELNPTMYKDTIYSSISPIKSIRAHDEKEPGIYLTVCKTCKGILDSMSEDVVEKALVPFREQIDILKREIFNMRSQIQGLQKTLAHHTAQIAQALARLGLN